jgi:hypothetical protein
MSRKRVHMSRNFLDRGVGGENLFFLIVIQMVSRGQPNRSSMVGQHTLG